MARRNASQVNAGSMADIAFLLLIFFLVTTTIDKDKGILRQLPPPESDVPTEALVSERNILVVNVNSDGALLVDDALLPLQDLKETALAFIDNGAITDVKSEIYCGYCKGEREATSSDHPKKAVIALTSNRDTKYGDYIKVQNILTGAYNTLRNRSAQELYGYSFTQRQAQMKEGAFKGDLEQAKRELKVIKEMYPMLISETETERRI